MLSCERNMLLWQMSGTQHLLRAGFSHKCWKILSIFLKLFEKWRKNERKILGVPQLGGGESGRVGNSLLVYKHNRHTHTCQTCAGWQSVSVITTTTTKTTTKMCVSAAEIWILFFSMSADFLAIEKRRNNFFSSFSTRLQLIFFLCCSIFFSSLVLGKLNVFFWCAAQLPLLGYRFAQITWEMHTRMGNKKLFLKCSQWNF